MGARLPLWGGSGLKYPTTIPCFSTIRSPSLGREWIEMPGKKRPRSESRAVSLFGEGVD